MRRAHKAVEAALAELGVSEPTISGSRSVCGAWLALRKEVIDRLEVWPLRPGEMHCADSRPSGLSSLEQLSAQQLATALCWLRPTALL